VPASLGGGDGEQPVREGLAVGGLEHGGQAFERFTCAARVTDPDRDGERRAGMGFGVAVRPSAVVARASRGQGKAQEVP
jgi:hypothetical protein